MNYKELKALWKKEEQMSFKGWDFSHLQNRWEGETLPWNYKNILIEYIKPTHKLLDIGTGGGEFLLSLNHPYENTSVTEMWEPNVKLCKEKLEPLGIEVKHVLDNDLLPFEDDKFDIIINRHASYSIKEVKRILKPNGLFITQQVGGKNNEILSKLLIKDFKPLYKENTLDNTLREIDENYFESIYSNEYFSSLKFKDIGAIVYFAKIIEWEFPNFSVDKCFNELCRLDDKLNNVGYIESFEHRYIIVCKSKK